MPSGVEVAQAYITIIPSMRGIQGDIAKQLNAEKIGSDAGKKLGDGMAKEAAKSSDALMKSFGSVGDRIAFKTRTGLETAFGKVAATAKDKMGAAATAIGNGFKAVGQRIAGTALGTAIGNAFSKIGSVASGAFAKVTGTIKGVAQFAGGAFKNAAVAIGGAFKTVAERVGSHLGPIATKAKEVFEKVGGFAGKAFKSVAKSAAVGAAAATAALGGIVKGSLDSYAEYEQLAGGVKKLYGDSADQLMAYAQEAYKTSGMSANEYMEQATSFSAALIKSTGGDTAKAAELADVAMRAMSDNVNTFGTDAESVSAAIGGLAKGNYTMLDNLKLGYAGTQEGMLDLINDSGVLGEKLTDTSQLADVGFGTMVEAIQAVQEQQGIAGTTAAEAAGTISGSIGMAKASWSNLLTELGKDDGDVGARTQELVDSVVAVIENVGPRVATIVGTIFNQLPGIIQTEGPKLAAALATMLDGVTNGGFSKAVAAVQPYTDRIGAVAGNLWNRLKPLAPIVVEIGGKLGGILKSALDVAIGAFETLAPIVATIAEHALPILSSALGIASSAFSAVVDVVSPIASLLMDGLGAAIDFIGEGLEGLADLVEGVFGKIADAAGAVGDFLQDPIGGLQKFAEKASKSFGATGDSAERNGRRVEKAWNKKYTTEVNAKADTSSAQTSINNFKKNNAGFTVSGKASLDTSGASKTLADWKKNHAGFTITGNAQIRTPNSGMSKQTMATGGIVTYKHAAGYIANRPTIISQHIVGEAGAEAVIPLTNQRYVGPFAHAVADFINQPNGGVNVYLTYNGSGDATELVNTLTRDLRMMRMTGAI